MTKLPQFLRSKLALRQTVADAHPPAGVLAAFAERTLSMRERGGLLEHLAGCPECREVLAAASPQEVRQTAAIASWKWRWAGAAAAAFLVAALFWLPGSFENTSAERTRPAPVAPLAPKMEEPPKADIAKPRILSSRRTSPVLPQKSVADAQPRLTLRQTVSLPPLTLNLTPPEPPAAIAETASLQIRQANNDSRQLVPRPQPQKPAQNRTGIVASNRMLEFGLHARAARSKAPPTLRPDGEKSLWTLDGTLRKSNDGGRTWSVVHVDDQARLYALSAAGSDVWVGGADGALFHSLDGGLNWKPIVVATTEARLLTAITGIDARDENWVRLKTQSGDWLTVDGGLHWRRD